MTSEQEFKRKRMYFRM